MCEKKLVPKLRFSGFNETWVKSNLGNVSSDEMYGMNSAATDFDGFNKYIRITDISESSNKFVPSPLTSPDGNLDEKFKLKEGDIVFARTGASTGKTYIYDKNDGNLYFAGFLIKFNINKAYPKFVFYNTLKDEYKNWVSVMSVRSGQPGINSNEYKKLPLNIPSLDEQKKISDFLESIDSKINLLKKKYEYYQEFKKYLMQQIFAGKLRFDFNDDWQDHTFKELLIEVNEKTTVNNQHEILSSTKEGIFTQKEYFANRNVASKDNTGYKILRKNQIVLSPQNLWMGNINVNTEFEIGIVSPSYKIYETTDLIEIDYFKHIIKLPRLIYEYKCASEQGASIVRRNLNKQLFDEITISIPSLKEQQKIGNMLTLIDKKITETSKQIDESKEFKKGLLQQMFDNMLFKNIIYKLFLN